MRRTLLVVALVLAHVVTANASKDFLTRDGALSDAYLYPYGDGEEDPADEEGEPEPRWELPGLWSLWFPPPARQSLVAGPTFRQQEFRTELGAAFAYVNRQLPRHPFQMSVETTWARFKHREPDNRNFRRVRLAGNVQLARRSSHWEGTALAYTTFFQNQNSTFTTIENGLAITELIGQRLSISANGFWRRRYNVGGDVLDGAVGSFGTAYNFGAGVRFGGFYELYDKVDRGNDWGMFLSYQFLPWAEVIVDGGKFEFVRARLLFSWGIEGAS